MMSVGIVYILLLINIISTVRGGFQIICRGQCTTLSCPGTNIEVKVITNVLWKKQTGETVIWRDLGVDKGGIGDPYKNRKVNISEDLSLVIGECDHSDQGVYILHINGQQSCQVRLLVNDKCKRSSDNLCGKPQTSTDEKQEHEDLQIQTSWDRNHFGVIILSLLSLILILSLFAYKKKINKNASEFKEMSPDCTAVQSNTASEHFI